MNNNSHYLAIKEFYGERKALRSQIPLINHINEGLAVLDKLGCGERTKEAFCIHPLLQSDGDFLESTNDEQSPFVKYYMHPVSVALAMEYRHVANSYLSKHCKGPRAILPFICDFRIRDMLIADKVQNYKDFLATYEGANLALLSIYFNNWLRYLDITPDKYEELTECL